MVWVQFSVKLCLFTAVSKPSLSKNDKMLFSVLEFGCFRTLYNSFSFCECDVLEMSALVLVLLYCLLKERDRGRKARNGERGCYGGDRIQQGYRWDSRQ